MKNKEEITKKAFHQCYQLIVFLRFYVKSILENLEVVKFQFVHCKGFEFYFI